MSQRKKAPELTFQEHIANFLIREHRYGVLDQPDITDDERFNSDVDFLVVTGNEVENTRKVSVRIRRALRGIGMPMDILVVPERKWLELKDEPGFIYRETLKNGKATL